MIFNFFSKISLLFITTTLFFACESHEKKADTYVPSKYSIKVSKGEKKIANQKEEKHTSVKKIYVKHETPNEWIQFKIDTEKKIIANDMKIKRIKSNPETSQKMVRQLINLEEANNDLKIQLAIFNQEVILKWESFKTTMNQDVNKIGIEIEDISSN